MTFKYKDHMIAIAPVNDKELTVFVTRFRGTPLTLSKTLVSDQAITYVAVIRLIDRLTDLEDSLFMTFTQKDK